MIGVVTTSYPRHSGDPAGGFVADHVHWLARQGYAVEVIAAGPGAAVVDGISVERIDSPLFYDEGAPDRLARDPRYWIEAARFSLRLARAVRRRSPRWERAFAHWLAPCGVAAALACPRRVPVTAIAHSGDVHLLRRTRLARVALAALARANARVVFVTAGLRDALVPGPTRLRTAVCSMGIDVPRFERLRRPPRDGAPTVLCLGRLVPVKGVDVLVDAMAQVSAEARLVVAGGGPELAALRERAWRRGLADVTFTGPVSTARRDELLAGADLLVLPSVQVEGGRTEGMPVAVLEAMAAGVPVVASRVGGMVDVPDGAAVLVPPGHPDALAAAIDRVLATPSARMVEGARAVARSRDWDQVGPRLLDV